MPALMPVMAVHGAQSGPTVLVTACVHGDEVLGSDVVRRTAARLDPQQMRGTFIGIPMANIGAVGVRNRRNLSEIYPGPLDMNRVFPGNPQGVLTDRVAHVLTETFIKIADFVLDLHMASAGAEWLPYAGVPRRDECSSDQLYKSSVDLARSFSTPLLLEGSIVGSVVEPALKLGVAASMAEFGVAGAVDKENLEFGLRGVWNVLKFAGVVGGDPDAVGTQIWVKKLHRLSAERGGYLNLLTPLGAGVGRGQQIATIEDLTGAIVQSLEAPEDGIICRVNTMGVVGTGDPVAHVGVV